MLVNISLLVWGYLRHRKGNKPMKKRVSQWSQQMVWRLRQGFLTGV
ncbi:hypothetical protein TR2A62_3525 [Thalassobium sp. R2A62]|nr:hypothetical protein TR2A62_3525 [Thalassobium sp. R2A62]